MVPIAHANDGGGSIRIPASACGLVGLKPTRGRTSLGPDQSELVSFLTVELCVSRSVRDTAGVLQAVHGRFPGDPTTAPLPAHPYTDEVGADPGKLRIGLMTTDPLAGGPMHPDCVAAAESTARLLESLGHEVEISQPPGMADPELLTKFSMVWAANCAYYVDDFGHKVGREATAEDVELLTWAMTEFGRSVTAPAYLDAIADAVRFSRRAASWWYGSEGFDLLLTPTLGEPPLPHGTLDSTPENPLAGFARSATFTPCTAQFNMTGQPAISLPMHWNDDNLPIGIQLVADFAREDLLIRIASQLEEAQPWADRVPPVHA
jgi:amidase